jgi:hypothetical protein
MAWTLCAISARSLGSLNAGTRVICLLLLRADQPGSPIAVPGATGRRMAASHPV